MFLRHYERSTYVVIQTTFGKTYCVVEDDYKYLKEAIEGQLYYKKFIEITTVYGHKLTLRTIDICAVLLMSPDGVKEEYEDDDEEAKYNSLGNN